MSNCNHKFGHMLNIGDSMDYYMCSLCKLVITEEHHDVIEALRAMEEDRDMYRSLCLSARYKAAKEACQIAAENGCTDHRFMCAVRISKALADHFELEYSESLDDQKGD